MTFPATPLGMTVELLINGTWTNVTSLVYRRDSLTVTRGRTSEATKVDRSTAKFTANNRNGNLSPRNPVGAYYGLIGRNTPCRVRLSPAPAGYLLSPVELDGAQTPDSANLSITGDIDIRIDVIVDTWTARTGLCNKFGAPGQWSWTLSKTVTNTLTFSWSADGTTPITKASTAAVTVPASGRLALRVTLDVDNGAAGNTVTFYTAPDISGPWTQLGATVVTAGTTSIFDSTAPVQIGRSNSGIGLVGRVYAFQVYQGIAGTLRASVDLDSYEAGAATFTDPQGNLWTLLTDASIVDPSVRFIGEISEWPQRWDVTGRDVYVPIEASGILRRLGQGASALKSTLYRGYTSATFTPRAYWPCEDGADATEIASAIGGPPMRFQDAARPTLASFDGFKCSDPLPTLQGSHWLGNVASYTGTGKVQVWFLMHIPTGAATVGKRIITIYTAGTGPVASWILSYASAGGNLTFAGFDAAGTQLFTDTAAFDVNDRLLRVDIELQQNGANIDWNYATLEVGASVGGLSSGTLNANNISRCHAVRVAGDNLGNDIAIGHISVHDSVRSLFDLWPELLAYDGEAASRRIERLCGEEGVTFRAVGNPDASAAMGPQLPAELVTLLQDAADADGGILYEPRDLFGLAYRTRESLYDQTARLALDYAAAHLSGIEPVDDDQAVRNDITVKRTAGSSSGSSARAVASTGPLSILPPPGGVGRYDEQVTLNLAADSVLADAAGWLLHLGTVDEARYPVLQVDLARAPFVASSALALAAQDLDVGDRLTVDNPPSWLPPDDITQLAQGMAETMGNFTHRIEVNCSPETPWGQAAIYDDGASRYSSNGTTLNEVLDTTETGVDVLTPTGRVWSHADGDFDIRVGGEVMTVTAISGAGSAQTFTVTRSVNGVVKAHASGEAVTLDHPRVYVR